MVVIIHSAFAFKVIKIGREDKSMSKYMKIYPIDFENKTVVVDYLYGKIILIDKPINYINSIINNDKYDKYDKNVRSLFEKTKIIGTNNDYIKIKEILDNEEHKFYMTILTTEECNLNCIYCYQTKKQKMIKSKVLIQLIKIIKEQILDKYDYLNINWFGGEPLLNWKAILEFCSMIPTDVMKKIKIDYLVVTNGIFLTNEIILKLYENGIKKYQITIDGDKENHDKNRSSNKYDSTYDIIIKNIQAVMQLNLPIKFIIRVNITKTFDFYKFNSEEIKNINKSGKVIFSFHIARDFNNANIENIIKVEDDSEYLIYNYKQAILNNLNVDIGKFFSIGGVKCYAGNKGSLVVFPDGQVCKCTVEGVKDGDYNVFNIGKIRDKYNEWTNINLNCVKCNLFPICLGNSCPRLKVVNNEMPCFRGKAAVEAIRKIYLDNVIVKGEKNEV